MKENDFKKLKVKDWVTIPQEAVGIINAHRGRVAAKVDSLDFVALTGMFTPMSHYKAADVPGVPFDEMEAEDWERLLDEPVEEKCEVTIRDSLPLSAKDVEPYSWEYSHPNLYVQITEYDKKAVAAPNAFMRYRAEFSWEKAKGFYKRFETARKENPNAAPPDDSLSHPDGGMKVLLDYRSWYVKCLLEGEGVKNTVKNSTLGERKTALQYCGIVDDDISDKFLKAIKAPGNDAPGSTEPTSDIDLNTFNQGTECLVMVFNSNFAIGWENHEAGIVFDVNVYAKDFKPDTSNIKGKRRLPSTVLPLFILPIRDHVFIERSIEYIDADKQLRAGLLKLRRYMAERTLIDAEDNLQWLTSAPEWTDFKKLLKESGLEKMEGTLYSVDQEFKKNQSLLGWTINQAAGSKKDTLRNMIAQFLKDNSIPESALPALDSKKVADRNKLMAAENRIYEVKLQKVAAERAVFELTKFADKTNLTIGADSAYLNMRSSLSDALYFANEAYVTSGAVTQVVSGKQTLGAGVKSDRKDAEDKANIAYGAHELAHSIVDQLADIYKETKRHYLHHPEQAGESENTRRERLGDSILAAAKYIHRLFNAIKHLYLIIGIVDTHERLKLESPHDISPHDIWTGAFERYPENDFENLTQFVVLMRLGFGLESLKKLEPFTGGSEPVRKLLETKFSLQNPDDETDPDEGEMFGSRRQIKAKFFVTSNEVIAEIQQANYSKELLAAHAIHAYLRKCLKDSAGMDFWKIEDIRKALTKLVVHVLADYNSLVSPGSDKLDIRIRAAMAAAKRPYPRLNDLDEDGDVPIVINSQLRPTPPAAPNNNPGRKT